MLLLYIKRNTDIQCQTGERSSLLIMTNVKTNIDKRRQREKDLQLIHTKPLRLTQEALFYNIFRGSLGKVS